MPIVPPPSNGSANRPRVLVTGANGYIGMWVVHTLLEQGYAVRGAIRTEDKAKVLGITFQKYEGRTEWVVIEDICKDSGFDEAVKDVDAIVHTASPLDVTTDDPNEYINPAVNGTLGVLKSTLKFGTRVKRIVVTSSGAAVADTNKPGKTPQSGPVFDEGDWGDEAVEIVEREGRKASDNVKYRASKTLAERAAWKFVEEHKSEIGWELTCICPPLVVGPSLSPISSPSALNSSLSKWYRTVVKEVSDNDLKASYGFVDVRDAALGHVKALQICEAAGERIIVSAGETTWQATRDVANEVEPKLYADGVLPRGNPSLPKQISYGFDNTKSKQILQMEYVGLEKTISDLLADFSKKGWLERSAGSAASS